MKTHDDTEATSRPPHVRLAWFDIPAVNNTLNEQTRDLVGPTVRLAHKSAQGDGTLTGKVGNFEAPKIPPHHAPPLLVSYVYVRPFIKNRDAYVYRDWVMDSGAFSAHNTGAKIELSEYVDYCLALMESDPTLTEVFALDEIPKSPSAADSAKALDQSMKNTEEMWRQGVPAIPCFHFGEPEEVLLALAKEYPKVALGGMIRKGGGSMGQDDKFAWLEQCFARVWPKRIHGFGVSAERMVWGLPFHSVDATNWEIGPCAFGNWQKFGPMSVRGSNQDLRSQVKHYLEMEAKARVKWEKEMALLDRLDADPATSWHGKAQQAAAARAARPQRAASAPAQAPAPDRPAKAAPAAARKPAKQPIAPASSAQAGKMPEEWEDYWAKRFK